MIWLLADHLWPLPPSSLLAHFTTTTQAFLNKPNLLLSQGLVICLECSIPRSAHGSLPYFVSLITFLLLRKDLVEHPILSGDPCIENAVGPHPYLLSLLKKSSAALMGNFLYRQLACYLQHLCLCRKIFLRPQYLLGLWVVRTGRTRITALRNKLQPIRGRIQWIHNPAFSPLGEKFQGMYYIVSLRVYMGFILSSPHGNLFI